MDHQYRAAESFLSGSNCAQAVLLAFGDCTGLDPETASRLASGFGGGMGRLREVCGAFSGMLMALDLLYGYTDPGENDTAKKAHYALVQELAARFKAETGSLICREILGNPPTDPSPCPRTAEYYATRPCTRMVMVAARILEEYMAEHPAEQKK